MKVTPMTSSYDVVRLDIQIATANAHRNVYAAHGHTEAAAKAHELLLDLVAQRDEQTLLAAAVEEATLPGDDLGLWDNNDAFG